MYSLSELIIKCVYLFCLNHLFIKCHYFLIVYKYFLYYMNDSLSEICIKCILFVHFLWNVSVFIFYIIIIIIIKKSLL